ncbi:rhodanese-like domain-containing protein [uncultured Tateyamaria sp.]|uniref:rhodanese-like domain-containing protein n=1 Tax=uncultured Tateyamaria sp. TaxID=455651 RepID=UPI00260BEBB8|nr:rhodanese-like domain-containing protein [uncultured Tateyamaria sp.]
MDQTLTISADDVMRKLATPKAPTLIDVCIPEDIAADPWRVPGARHVSHLEIQDWAGRRSTPGPVVVICKKGLKLSHGAAALLRIQGIEAHALEGGNQNWAARNLPRIALHARPKIDAAWVLPAKTSNAIVAAWIIYRWFDPAATVMWVPAPMCTEVAMRFDATAPHLSRLALFCMDIGLDHPPLSAFLAEFDQGTPHWLPLLRAAGTQEVGPEGACGAALPILDAAWVAHLDALREVA